MATKGKRERLEVIYDILHTIKNHNNSIKPTPLLRYSNLSFNSFQEYEEELLNKKLMLELQDKKGKRYYSLTDRGFTYLQKYSIILNFIEEFEL